MLVNNHRDLGLVLVGGSAQLGLGVLVQRRVSRQRLDVGGGVVCLRVRRLDINWNLHIHIVETETVSAVFRPG